MPLSFRNINKVYTFIVAKVTKTAKNNGTYLNYMFYLHNVCNN